MGVIIEPWLVSTRSGREPVTILVKFLVGVKPSFWMRNSVCSAWFRVSMLEQVTSSVGSMPLE